MLRIEEGRKNRKIEHVFNHPDLVSFCPGQTKKKKEEEKKKKRKNKRKGKLFVFKEMMQFTLLIGGKFISGVYSQSANLKRRAYTSTPEEYVINPEAKAFDKSISFKARM